MNLKGRKQSTNVEDRRGQGGKIAVGGGIAGIVVAGLMFLLGGGDISQFMQQIFSGNTGQTTSYNPSAEEEELNPSGKKR